MHDHGRPRSLREHGVLVLLPVNNKLVNTDLTVVVGASSDFSSVAADSFGVSTAGTGFVSGMGATLSSPPAEGVVVVVAVAEAGSVADACPFGASAESVLTLLEVSSPVVVSSFGAVLVSSESSCLFIVNHARVRGSASVWAPRPSDDKCLLDKELCTHLD